MYKEEGFPNTAENIPDCDYIRRNYCITKNQLHMCKKRKESMVFVHEAAQMTVRTCQTLFRYKQWNCSTLALLPTLLPDLNDGKLTLIIILHSRLPSVPCQELNILKNLRKLTSLE